MSNAALHWVADHERMWRVLRAVLEAGFTEIRCWLRDRPENDPYSSPNLESSGHPGGLGGSWPVDRWRPRGAPEVQVS